MTLHLHKAQNVRRRHIYQTLYFFQPFSIVHGVLRVELIQVSQGGQFYVNQYLIEQGFADEAEESALSKVRTDPGLSGWPVLREPVPHRAGVC